MVFFIKKVVKSVRGKSTRADPGSHVRGGGQYLKYKIFSCERRWREAMLVLTIVYSDNFFK